MAVILCPVCEEAEVEENNQTSAYYKAKDLGWKPNSSGDLTCPKCSVQRKTFAKKKKPVSEAVKARRLAKKEKDAEEKAIYHEKRAAILKKNPYCAFPNCKKRATDCHHKGGREGDRMLDDDLFVGLCHPHHMWIEDHPKEAFEMGLKTSRHWTYETRRKDENSSD